MEPVHLEKVLLWRKARCRGGFRATAKCKKNQAGVRGQEAYSGKVRKTA